MVNHKFIKSNVLPRGVLRAFRFEWEGERVVVLKIVPRKTINEKILRQVQLSYFTYEYNVLHAKAMPKFKI